ncbi:MAG TPA: UDP-glucose/GDP-mannose dehydrogenase family protein [Acidimicrobiales bacterium]|nr:UDP-glucose/GDP-mannose dehydrogenase family protein [Acidimicrobiales bacterium]
MTQIAVVGAGYVGLTTAACMAHLGHSVICADIVEDKIASLRTGVIPIVEDGLQALVQEGLESGRLTFVLGAATAAPGQEVVFLCVPTPQRPDGSADMSFIEIAAKQISPILAPGSIVVNKSTVPVGSTRVVEEALQRSDILVVSNPEFLREGSAVHDFLNPDRIVIGSDDQAAAIRIAGLYSGINAPIVTTDPASAETIKYASNAFLATKISFVNAIANLCEAVGADVRDVILGIGYDGRIGFEFLKPGPGWGGSCLPKDTKALVSIADNAGYDFRLLKGVISVNEEQKEIIIRKILGRLGGAARGSKIAVWGLTFKARTDDLRDSPALEIALRLAAEGWKVAAYDPTFSPESPRSGSEIANLSSRGIDVRMDPYAACEGADVLAVLTEWDEFRWLDFGKVAGAMSRKQIVDGRNLLDGSQLKRLGFSYEGVGRA